MYRSLLALIAIFVAGAALFAATNAYAGRVHPDLEARLATLPPGDPLVAVIVVLEEQAKPSQAAAHLPNSNRKGRGRAVVEALRATASRGQAQVLGLLGREQAQGNVHEVRPFWVINGLAATANAAAIRRIAAHKDVREVRFDAAIAPPIRRAAATPAPSVSADSAWNIAQVRAPEVWAIDPAYNGTGIVIGSFDTGVDGTHPDLAPRYRGNHAISWFDPYGQHATPFDNNGHGTHTTGTMVGGDASGYNIGVAPGARWIAAKAWNDRDSATVSAFHQIFEWFLAPGGDPANAPDVVNNSWGQSPPDCYGDFLPDVLAMRAAGIFPAFASGNEGPDAGTALGPGNLAEAFSVGATDFDDGIADFSSRGPSQCDAAIKPDISAPGVSILSTLPDDFYYELDGTSMATPHVSGAAAVLLSINPDLGVDDIESALVLGAVDVGAAGPDNDSGSGRLDLLVSASIVLGVPRVGIIATTPIAREAGGVPGRFTVTRSESAGALTVAYAVSGTGTPGSDYVALPGSVTFPAGVASVDIVLTPIDDNDVEADETVVVTLAANPAFLTSPAAATVTIVSDELLPDLTVNSMTAPAAGGAGVALPVSATIANVGAGTARASSTRFYLSANNSLDAGDVLLGSGAVPALGPGASNTSSVTLMIPAGTAAGAWYLIAKTDGDDALLETRELNNFFPRPISIGPDLVVSAFSVPYIAGAGLPMTVTDTVTNQGGSPTAASTISFHLSANPTLDSTDALIGSRTVPALAPGASHTGSVALAIPEGTTVGMYYVFAKADSGDAVPESNEANNINNRTVVIGPDLIVNAFAAAATAGAGTPLAVTDTIRNTGGGAAPATVTRFYLSANTVVDAGDVALGGRIVAPLAPGASDTGTVSLTIPAGTASGNYYLIAKTDGDDALIETQEFNNFFYRPLAIGADLAITALTVPGIGGAGLAMSLGDSTVNQGGSTAAASTTTYYLSADPLLDAGDVVLGSRALPALPPGVTSTGSVTVTIPAGTATGMYYIFARADAGGVVTETNEANNGNSRTVVIGPDLIINAFSAPATAGAGATLSVTDATRNSGGGASPATVTRFYLSANGSVDASDVVVGSRAVPSLAPNTESAGSTLLAIPAGTASGVYYLIAKADGDDALAESQELNNSFARTLAIGTDLVISSFTVPGVAGAGLPMVVSATTTNSGGSAAAASTLSYYLSTDSVFGASDVLLGSHAVSALAAGASSPGSASLTIPAGTAVGLYYVFARADSGDAVVETSETNNFASRTVVIGPDLTVTALSAPATGGAGAAVVASDTTRNTGGGAAVATSTRYYLSANTTLDAGDVALGSRAVAALPPGATDSGSVSLTIPAATASGTWYLIARADGDDALAETQESNNLLARPISIGADLIVTSFTVPGVAGAGLAMTVSDTTSNPGGSAAAASTTSFYLSTNALLDAGDVLIGSRSIAALAPGASSAGSASLAIPAGTATGMYYVLARADSDDAVVETSETNNINNRTVVIGPDLVINAFSAPASSAAGASLTATDTTRNSGGGSAASSTTRFYLSTNSILDAGDLLLGSRGVAALAPNGSDTASSTLTIPAGTASGTWYLIAKADGDDALVETQELNNAFARPISIGPDLAVTAFTVPGIAGAGLPMAVSDTVANQSAGATVATTISFHLSANAMLDAGDVLLGSRSVAALSPGATDAGSLALTIPAGTATGMYYVFARADSDDLVAETSETNNTANRTVMIGPDLVIQAFSAASTVAAGASLAITETTRNTGGGAAPATLTRYYLSTNFTVDASDLVLGSRGVAGLAPGASDPGALSLVIPAGTTPGNYYLIAKADGDDALVETYENNNGFWRPLQVTP